eukprot:Hpha_TRINITY_DN15188_c1_g11::TRINITY_DN15188_c1_g11_i1::g.128585::m.128585
MQTPGVLGRMLERDLKFGDKVSLTSQDRLGETQAGALAVAFSGDEGLPVLELWQKEPLEFERAVFEFVPVSAQRVAAVESERYVKYGVEFRLKNVATGLFLGVGPEDGSCIFSAECPNTEEDRHKAQLFSVPPRPGREGERIRYDDPVLIRSVHAFACTTTGRIYVHRTPKELETPWKSERETKSTIPPRFIVGLAHAESKGSWKIEQYQTEPDTQHVVAGSAVVLFNHLHSGFVMCDWELRREGLGGDLPDVFLDHHNIMKATFQVVDLPYSSNAIWIAEPQQVRRGGPLKVSGIRLRHLATGL